MHAVREFVRAETTGSYQVMVYLDDDYQEKNKFFLKEVKKKKCQKQSRDKQCTRELVVRTKEAAAAAHRAYRARAFITLKQRKVKRTSGLCGSWESRGSR